MPCTDSSSSISFQTDLNENFISFEYAKITCGREITAETGLNTYFKGWALPEILSSSFFDIQKALKITEEDSQFVLYMEWDALRSAVCEFLGVDHDNIDRERCQITAIEHTEDAIEVALIILPPKELPKILPCSLADEN